MNKLFAMGTAVPHYGLGITGYLILLVILILIIFLIVKGIHRKRNNYSKTTSVQMSI